MVTVSDDMVNVALAAYLDGADEVDWQREAMREALKAALSYQKLEEHRASKMRAVDQRAADMRRERAQRALERDAAAHRRHMKSQGWDM